VLSGQTLLHAAMLPQSVQHRQPYCCHDCRHDNHPVASAGVPTYCLMASTCTTRRTWSGATMGM
jgi:hypothetical protein